MELEKMTSSDLFTMSEFCGLRIKNLSLINQDGCLSAQIDQYRDCKLVCDYELEKMVQPIIDAHVNRRIDELK